MESLNARAQLSGLIRICKHFGLVSRDEWLVLLTDLD